MTEAEEIKSAIHTLTLLSTGCLPAPWDHCYTVSGGEGDSSIRSGERVVADLVEPHHADLISILHRTIDAQLGILNLALYHSETGAFPAHPSHLALARAINGGTTA